MFGFFKKNEGKPMEQEVQEDREKSFESVQLKVFSSQFLPKERSILAVTWSGIFNGEQAGYKELWMSSTRLTAWKEENSSEVHRGDSTLVILGTEQLLDLLRRRAPPDSVIKFHARVSADNSYLLLLDLPEPCSDLELKLILREQKKPVTFFEEGLGEFALNRQVGWFEAELDWLGVDISLIFDQEEDRADCVQHAKTLLADAERWDRRVRDHAAYKLTALANDWAEQEEITREQFMDRMELTSIEVRADGSFEFWFDDGDMFCGHSIYVSGNLEDGPTDANMEE